MAVRVEMNYGAVSSEILFSEGLRRDMAARAARVAAQAGDGVSSQVQRGTDRYRGAVWTESVHAKRSEAKNHTLLKALDAAR